MIGAAYSQSVTGLMAGGDYAARISPPSITDQTTNGGYTSISLRAIVYNGVGPFTYDWRSPDAVINSPSDSETTFFVSGVNETVNGVIICVVTDQGNANEEFTTGFNFSIQFG